MNKLRVLLGLTLILSTVGSQAVYAANVVPKPIVVLKKIIKGQVTHTYTFTLTTFKITDTRSRHEDTDFVSVAEAVGNGAPAGAPTKAMGDLNNGTFTVNLSVQASALPTDSVSFTYGIVNSGYDANKLETALKKAVSDAASKGAKAGISAAANTILPGSGSIASAAGSGYADELIADILDVVFPDCDGAVAGGNHVFSGAQLAAQTANGHVISGTDNNKGTNSPTGCGSNSQYYVSWTIKG
jgi:hypothetical protein